jgi:hypothetical protein
VLEDVARVFLETHGDAAEGHGLAAEDVGKTKPHRVAPEVGLDDGAEGLVERLIVVGVRKGEALVGLNGGRGEGGGRTGRKDRRNRRRIDEEGRRSGGPGGDPLSSPFLCSRKRRWQVGLPAAVQYDAKYVYSRTFKHLLSNDGTWAAQ